MTGRYGPQTVEPTLSEVRLDSMAIASVVRVEWPAPPQPGGFVQVSIELLYGLLRSAGALIVDPEHDIDDLADLVDLAKAKADGYGADSGGN